MVQSGKKMRFPARLWTLRAALRRAVYSTFTHTSPKMHSLPVTGSRVGSVVMCRYLPSILKRRN